MIQIKICGITEPDQGWAIAQQGAAALGFICAHESPRYVTPEQIRAVTVRLPASLERVGVFVNATLPEILSVVEVGTLTTVQLHGEEPPEFCEHLRKSLPSIKLMKAFRVRQREVLEQVETYTTVVDSVLLDAYHPTQHGGTGRSLDWSMLKGFRPLVPWYLAGGLTPDNVVEAIALARPDGVDLSSGVEHAPGQKDLAKVGQLFTQLRNAGLLA